MPSSSKLRKLIVNGAAYLYRLDGSYEHLGGRIWRARHVFIVYRAGSKLSPARAVFTTPSDAVAGAPLNVGYAVSVDGVGEVLLNLNQPRHARALIEALLELGWNPSGATPFQLDDGNALLSRLNGLALRDKC